MPYLALIMFNLSTYLRLKAIQVIYTRLGSYQLGCSNLSVPERGSHWPDSCSCSAKGEGDKAVTDWSDYCSRYSCHAVTACALIIKPVGGGGKIACSNFEYVDDNFGTT